MTGSIIQRIDTLSRQAGQSIIRPRLDLIPPPHAAAICGRQMQQGGRRQAGREQVIGVSYVSCVSCV